MDKVYLCGPMDNCTDSEGKDWRRRATEYLGADRVLNPWDWSNPAWWGRELTAGESYTLVRADLDRLTKSTIVLANLWKPSPGSSMELVYAFTYGIDVVVVAPKPVSPWVQYHADWVYGTLEEGLEKVKELLTEASQ